ncbi:YhgE/Pip domain-containing protein [Brachybacterium squillarum]|uniref:YhgE/Pip domain-containing protein n=1 Tax=Brachybacterium squillarum TaxID=661979 RepID=UPI00026297DB|nr:YhgE/Pip domain-containing protein [Brachybacterium squillarum]
MTRLLHSRILVLVLLLPVLVAGIGLWALSGRVDRLDDVPAAVVNLDEGAEMEVDGETQTVPLGRSVAGALTQPGTAGDAADTSSSLASVSGDEDTAGFDWQLTSEDDAYDGLRDGSYAAVIVIPEDFSENLVTIGTTDAAPAMIEVTSNDANSQLNALIATAVTQAAATGLGGEMTEQYLDGIYLGFDDLKDGYQEAADGADELADGSGELSDGLDQSADGADQLAGGADELATGTEEFSGGVVSLADGAQQSADGSDELADGLGSLADGAGDAAEGSQELTSGLGQLSDGADDLAEGNQQLADGLDDLATGAEDLEDGVGALQTGMRGDENNDGLLDGAEQLEAGVVGDGTTDNPGLAAGADQLATGLEQYADGVSQAAVAVNGDGTDANPGLSATAEDLADGAATAGDGAQGIADATGAIESAVVGEETLAEPQMVSDAEAMEALVCRDYGADSEECLTAGRLLASTRTVSTVTKGNENGSLAEGAQGLATGLNGTDSEDGLVDGLEGVQQYADGLETAFNGDGSAENPGLIASADQLAEGARSSADGTEQLEDGVVALSDGLGEYAEGVDTLADGTGQLAEGARSSADGASDLADGADQLATGLEASASGSSELTGGLDQLAAGSDASADGASQLAEGNQQLADGADELATGSEQLADGSSELADGSGELADGTEQLADGSEELTDGTEQLADGLQDGADQVPSYSEDERDRMSAQAASPVDTEADRENEASGATTAIFPFVVGLALWLGAFAAALLLPALSRKLMDRAMPMWKVALRSLLPSLAVAAAQTVAVLAVITAIGISPVSPLAVAVVALAGAIMFAMLHQALMVLCGNRVGRLLSVILVVLQVVALVGILPIETAPPALEAIAGFMPLTIVTEGLTHAALGGSLVSTLGTLGTILVWAAISLVITLVAARGARRVDGRRAAAPSGAEPVAA